MVVSPRCHLLGFLLSSLLLGCGGASTSGPGTKPTTGTAQDDSPPLFADCTASSGVQFTYRNGEEADHFAILESLGGGVGLLDYDGDGLLDIALAGGGFFQGQTIHGHPTRLFRNLGNWRFADVTTQVGLDRHLFYSHAIAVADYDRDGWPDLLVTGWGRLALFHNEVSPQGGRRFVEVGAKAGFTDHLWASSAAWGDLDGDGWPDLYVCQYGDWSFTGNHPTDCYYTAKIRDVCPPRRFKALPHKIYRNQGDGTFRDIGTTLALRTDGKGLGVIMADVNNDGRPDLYVANDTDENFLYLNRSTKGQLRLEEKALLAGVARDDRGTPNGSMGVDAADFNGSGLASLWCTNYENELHALYRNDSQAGREFFLFCTPQAGIGIIGQTWVGWGTAFADFNRRGWEDLVIANGHAIRFPAGKAGRRQLPVLLHNDGGRFTDITARGGPYFRDLHNARGLALGDLDNDGKLDLAISHLNEPATLLRNVAQTNHHWFGLTLQGHKHRDVTGARVVVDLPGRRLTRFVKAGGSYASSHDRRLFFGLGTADKVEQITVHWPWGEKQTVPPPALDRYWRLVEGQDRCIE